MILLPPPAAQPATTTNCAVLMEPPRDRGSSKGGEREEGDPDRFGKVAGFSLLPAAFVSFRLVRVTISSPRDRPGGSCSASAASRRPQPREKLRVFLLLSSSYSSCVLATTTPLQPPSHLPSVCDSPSIPPGGGGGSGGGYSSATATATPPPLPSLAAAASPPPPSSAPTAPPPSPPPPPPPSPSARDRATELPASVRPFPASPPVRPPPPPVGDDDGEGLVEARKERREGGRSNNARSGTDGRTGASPPKDRGTDGGRGAQLLALATAGEEQGGDGGRREVGGDDGKVGDDAVVLGACDAAVAFSAAAAAATTTAAAKLMVWPPEGVGRVRRGGCLFLSFLLPPLPLFLFFSSESVALFFLPSSSHT